MEPTTVTRDRMQVLLLAVLEAIGAGAEVVAANAGRSGLVVTLADDSRSALDALAEKLGLFPAIEGTGSPRSYSCEGILEGHRLRVVTWLPTDVPDDVDAPVPYTLVGGPLRVVPSALESEPVGGGPR